MKVALLHYWLTNIRGGEKVFLELCEMFPQADIFTHVITPDIQKKYFPNRKIHTSFINKLPNAAKLYKNYMPLMFKASQSFDLRGYDLIISSESGPIKGIRKPEGTKHICYCHTPMRYLWDMFDDYYQNAPFYKKCAMKLLKNYLRKHDLYSANNVDVFIANSDFVKDRIRRIYNRDAEVIYPPVDVDFFKSKTDAESRKDYYLVAGELVNYKRVDIAVKAFNSSGKKLIVVGSGEEFSKLHLSAKSNITFTGKVSNEKLRKLYSEARALIFPGVEDFGIVPIEAQATSTPVIAYAQGGALETVVDGQTGIFFDKQTPEALNIVIDKFEKISDDFDTSKIRLHSLNFSRRHFRYNFEKLLENKLD